MTIFNEEQREELAAVAGDLSEVEVGYRGQSAKMNMTAFRQGEMGLRQIENGLKMLRTDRTKASQLYMKGLANLKKAYDYFDKWKH